MSTPSLSPPRHSAWASRRLAGDWLEAVAALRGDPGFWWLDSALSGPRTSGRFCYAGADPWMRLRAQGDRLEAEVCREVHPGAPVGCWPLRGDPLDCARALMPAPPPDPPEFPFVGGAVGYLGYELAASWLPFTPRPRRAADLPDLCLLFVDRLLAWDSLEGRLCALGLGFAEDPDTAAARAGESAEALVKQVAGRTRVRDPRASGSSREVAAAGPACSPFDAAGYGRAIETARRRIEAGDVYQVCLTHTVELDCPGDAASRYAQLRAANPAPFGALLTFPDVAVLSSSPERFLSLGRDRWVESRPIKGTRPRGATPEDDRALARELAASEKDRAENLMIVDLVRNDLGRVCELGSVHVPELMEIEPYARVFQMVSTVRGRLRPDRDVFDLVRAAFPAGSMTGAPKIAAMQILAELEPERRGPYAGALGYFDVAGGASLSVVIRTALLADGRARIGIGGGIVADSEPAAEWQESWDKAAALLDGFGAPAPLDPPEPVDAPEPRP